MSSQPLRVLARDPRRYALAACAALALAPWFLAHGFVAACGDPTRRLVAALALAAAAVLWFAACDATSNERAEPGSPPSADELRRARRASALRCAIAFTCAGVSLALGPTAGAAALVAGWVVLRVDPLLGAALLALELATLAAEFMPVLARPLESLAAALAPLVPSFAGATRELVAGPTPLALAPWLACSALVVLFCARACAWRGLALTLGALALVELAHLRAFHFSSGEPSSALAAFEALPWTVCALVLVAAVGCAGCARFGDAGERATAAPRASFARRALAPLALAAAAAALALGFASPLAPRAREPIVVRVWNEGGLDWLRPRMGAYGAFDGGMFGLLPVYLGQQGFRFDVIAGASVDDAALAGADVLLVVNCPKTWSEPEAAAVERFVRAGRGLLVLGDHTDVYGLQRGSNTLLERYGMRLRFDSAYHVRADWTGCVDAARGAPWHWTQPAFDSDHAIGASIETDGPWLLRAPFAFSDDGIRENQMGSFLGDYEYEQGERLGDLVLAAWRPVGDGRVAVYGDTSAFQNGSLVQSESRHLLALFHWLATPCGALERAGARAALALAALACGALALASTCIRAARASTTLALALGLAGGAHAADVVARACAPRARVDASSVLIDFSKQPWQGHYDAGMNVLTPLVTNLQRMGLEPRRSYALDEASLGAARAVAFVAPQVALSRAEVELLERYAERGGVVIVAAGYEQRAAVESLLADAGVELVPKPLGNVPVADFTRVDDTLPRFVDAWPIRVADGRAHEVLARSGDDVLAVFCPRGRGGLLVISDSRFFSERNVEGMWGHWPGNERFLHNTFEKLLRARAADVAPLFESPVKPS